MEKTPEENGKLKAVSKADTLDGHIREENGRSLQMLCRRLIDARIPRSGLLGVVSWSEDVIMEQFWKIMSKYTQTQRTKGLNKQ